MAENTFEIAVSVNGQTVAGRVEGRTLLAAGLVARARAEAQRTLTALSAFPNTPVIGIEPSCLLTLRDEFLSLLPGAEAETLAARSFLLAEFLIAQKAQLKLGHMPLTVHVHGHCHQKSFAVFAPTLALLQAIPGVQVKPITSSCCGMAGSFGYEAANQATSRAMAELSLLPAVRAAGARDIVLADGTSCRHQIADLGGREALHSIRLLDRALV